MVQETIGLATVLPDYSVDGELGRGGMGIVFGGRHRNLDRPVAIKQLPAGFVRHDDVRTRFAAEARVLAGLAHPHIVPIYDYVERDSVCLIVMEALPGGTVWDRFLSQGIANPAACAYVIATCAALQYAHDHGVLHLDVKPENVMFDRDENVKVTDFGIAKVMTGERSMATMDGAVVGTPAYMAPEQARGAEVGPAADICATGTMLYELLSGHLPFAGGADAADLLRQRLEAAPTPLLDVAPGVPPAIAEVAMCAIALDPADRFASAEALGSSLGRAAADAWGPNWIDLTGVAILGSELLSLAARTTTGGVRASTSSPAAPQISGEAGRSLPTIGPDVGPAAEGRAGATVSPRAEPPAASGRAGTTVGPGVSPPTADRGGETIGPGVADAPAAEADPTPDPSPVPSPAPPPADGLVVPGSNNRFPDADLNAVDRDDLVSVGDLIDVPEVPVGPAIAGGVLALLALVIALIGFGSQQHESRVVAQSIVVAGVDAQLGGPIPLDLGQPVEVVVEAGAHPDATRAGLSASVLGLPLGETQVSDLVDGRAFVDPGILRHTAAGTVAGRVELFDRDGELVATQGFEADSSRPVHRTATGAAALLLAVLAIAGLVANAQPLRQGRRSRGAIIGAAIAGGLAGASLAVLGAALGPSPATALSLIVCVVAGAAATAFGAHVLQQASRRQRLLRATGEAG